VRNNPCNRTDPNGRCSPPPGLKPGQVGVCIEAFIAAKTFKVIGRGNDRPFSANDESLTWKFRTDIIAERTPKNSKTFDVSQTTRAGVSQGSDPITGLPFGPPIRGTANTTLNGQPANSDGSSSLTTPIDKNGQVGVNVATTAENGFASINPIDLGTIRTSINLNINSNTGQVGIGPGSEATGYPSIAVYSYVYTNGKLVTTEIIRQGEGSPSALKEPMQPLPEVKPKLNSP